MNGWCRCWVVMAAMIFAMSAPAVGAEEANLVLHSTITGNQEQPKVLYIVPWQAPGANDQLQQPLQPLLDEVFEPVDRQELLRELRYREMVEKGLE